MKQDLVPNLSTIIEIEKFRWMILKHIPQYKLPTSLFLFCPINLNTLQTLSNNSLWFSNPAEFNDPFDCNRVKHIILRKKGKQEEINASQILDEVRIRSLSKEINNILLWSHYTDGHKGMAIEIKFDYSQLIQHQVAVAPVTYKITRDQKINSQNFSSNILTFYFSKKSFWRYEKEYRLFSFSPYLSKGHFLENNEDHILFRIKSITFGLKTPENIRQLVQKIIQVPFFIMKASKNRRGHPVLVREKL